MPNAMKQPLANVLGRYSIRDLDRLNHASELLAATAAGLDQLSTPAKGPLRQLVFEANQEILAVMQKPAAAFRRWHEANGQTENGGDNGGGSAETV